MPVFELHDTHGFSLTDSLWLLKQRNLDEPDMFFGVDWADWYRRTKKAGWPFDRVRRTVEEAVSDTEWPETFLDTVRSVFNQEGIYGR